MEIVIVAGVGGVVFPVAGGPAVAAVPVEREVADQRFEALVKVGAVDPGRDRAGDGGVGVDQDAGDGGGRRRTS